MDKGLRRALATAAIGVALLSGAFPAEAGNGSAIGAGLVGFGVGAVLGSMLAPPDVYYAPPPPPPDYGYYGYDDYYGPADYGPDDGYGPDDDYGPGYGPPPPRPHPRLKPPAPRAARQTHAVPLPARNPAKAAAPASAAQNGEAKFKAAQAKARRAGVENLTQEDIEGLSVAQLKQLRGY